MPEDETSNCPDCQMQLLQQQNCQMPMELINQEGNQNMNAVGPKTNSSGPDMQIVRTPTSHWEPLMSTISRLESHHRNPEEDLMYCSSSRPLVSINGGNPTSLTGGMSYTTSSNYSTLAANCSTNVALGPSTPTHPGSKTTSCDMLSNVSSCLTPIPEGCSGYCATCAVLELPANECYYRAPLTRHAVFPPLFYNQPPPLPGFSPIPECSPWSGCNSNDFPTFSFPSYSQQTAISDYFSNSGVVGSHVSSASSLDHSNFIDSSSISSGNANPVYPSPSLRMECSEQKRKASVGEKSLDENAVVDEDHDVVILPPSSNSSDDSSTADSESLVSQKELIVEDEDDDESVSVSICNLDRNKKCIVCQNTIDPDCSSPHLDNILEEIDEEITPEDLDITVSSADIEIGGIEDEVRCFHQKKIPANSSAMQINLERLAQVVGISPESLRNGNRNSGIDLNLISVNSHEYPSEEDAMVLLCGKCGKLAILADSLEKQLSNTIHILQELYYRNLTINFGSGNGKSDELRPPSNSKQDLIDSASENKIINSEMYQTNEQPENSDICHFKEFEHPVQTDSLPKKQISVGTQTFLSGSIIEVDDRIPPMTKPQNICPDSQQHETGYPCEILEFENIPLTIAKSVDAIDNGKSINSEKFSTMIEMQSFGISTDEESLIQIHNSETDRISNLHSITDLFNENIVMENVCKTVDVITDNCTKTSTEISNAQKCSVKSSESPENCRNEDCQPINHESNSYMLNSNLEMTKENETPCQSKSVKELKFMCDVCGQLLSTKRSLLQHLQRHEYQKEAGMHRKTSSQHGIYKSNTNPLATDSSLSNETISEDKQEHIVASEVSQKENHSSQNFNSRTLNANKEEYNCLHCGLCFKDKNRLEKHVSKNCQSKKIQCELCNRRFLKSSEMKAHLRVHAGQKPFSCEICSLTFSTKGNQVAHTRTHSKSKNFVCHICAKGFNRKMALQFHLNRHNGIRPYSCSLCELSFYDPSNLINHTKKTHNKKVNPVELTARIEHSIN